MIKRTHLAIGLALALLFLPHVNNKLLFFPIVLITCLLPDIDSADSYYGHKKIFRPLQFFVKHRGVLHSFTFCILISILLAAFIPILALPFFLGYASHLLADSFTIEGIILLWPFKKTSSGPLRTGGKIEHSLFLTLLVINLLLFARLFA